MNIQNASMLLPVPWTRVTIGDGFWRRRQEINRTVTLPLEYELNRKNGVIGAHQWEEWDLAKGTPPWRIWVGDLGKWIEAAAYSLARHPDPALEQRVDEVVESILKGQKDDGYLGPNPMPRAWRFRNLQELHELYEIGHDIEGAVALYEATGKRAFLDGICRTADLLTRTFGAGEGQVRGYDGHPEIELALMKLYRVTGAPRYRDLAKFFIEERGRAPLYFLREAEQAKASGMRFFDWYSHHRFDYCQAHKPLREQTDAVGHAVRALYLYSGMADVAADTGDAGLLAVCRRLWRSVVRRRMYVIGGVGSSPHGEAFTFDYDLPNETAYAETCANIALVFFAHRMLQVDAESGYADVMERALYNGVLSGISLDGRKFFYANHLTVYPRASGGAGDNVAAGRQEWFGCACCPPNIARLIASLGHYAYSTARDGVYVHLYLGGSVECQVAGQPVKIAQTTEYPWRETVRLTVTPAAPARFTLAVRLPGWCRKPKIKVNGAAVNPGPITKKGYACLARTWARGDRVELTFPMPVERIEANPASRMNCGKVALQRGPVVYCLEQADNGKELADMALPRAAKLTAEYRPKLLGGCVVIQGRAQRRGRDGWQDALYRATRSRTRTVPLLAVPYALWANRKPGEMITWLRES